ncbi:MAG TPA: AAA family ATPase [Planctomycetota bacterium]|nr:AAA family ATPase [Planctomycetota bacterium]
MSLGFLDYSTAEMRRFFAEEEVRLNQRLAPTIYGEVVSVREGPGGLVLAPPGEKAGREVEALVRMKRLPPGVTLADLIAAGSAGPEHIDRLLDLLVPFYARTARAEGAHGTPSVIRRTLAENHDIARDAGKAVISMDRLDAIVSGQLGFLTLHERLFDDRVREGWIRDGHGDLRAEHIVYLPGCAVMDCIEFNDRLRIIDVAADLAFLKMDLEFLGAPELGARLIDRYVLASGDEGLRGVLGLYTSYRAFVRGKVDLIKSRQAEVPGEEREMLIERARRYLELARFHMLEVLPAHLILVGGLSGSGKSTLSRLLSARLGAPLIRSDVVRKDLAGLGEGERRPGAFGEGLYSEDSTRRTYEAMAARARTLLEAGAAVVLDATFSRRWSRELARRAAHEAGASVVHLECRVPSEVALRWLEERSRKGRDASDATPSLLGPQQAAHEPCEPHECIPIDATPPPEAVLEAALDALRRALVVAS